MSGQDSFRIALGDNLDISVCEGLQSQLQEGLRAADRVVLDLAGATSVDISFLQILVAAQRTAERAGRSLALAEPPAGALATALARCGFSPPHGATSLAEILTPEAPSAP